LHGEDEQINEFKKFYEDFMLMSTEKYSDINNLLDAKMNYIGKIAKIYDEQSLWYKNEFAVEFQKLKKEESDKLA
jgi:hypothetical protein